MSHTEGEFIQDVSDTSAWVTHYCALESERPDSLFKDPFAQILVGDRSLSVDKMQSEASKWTRWTVVMRTYIIDQMIHDLVSRDFKTFLNLGAGFDSRPYRMNLSPEVQWIEVDFPHIIEYKRTHLEKFSPTCKLETVGLDLSNRKSRRSLFEELARKYPKIVVLTEGVLPYLTQEQVSELSEDLLRHSSFKYWICEYLSERSYRYLKNQKFLNS